MASFRSLRHHAARLLQVGEEHRDQALLHDRPSGLGHLLCWRGPTDSRQPGRAPAPSGRRPGRSHSPRASSATDVRGSVRWHHRPLAARSGRSRRASKCPPRQRQTQPAADGTQRMRRLRCRPVMSGHVDVLRRQRGLGGPGLRFGRRSMSCKGQRCAARLGQLTAGSPGPGRASV
jgi:hypothetical protein